ncbi:MAG: electron transfer flavoprotein subunit beta/FixA family protein [Desulfarculaceae bacterium]|nr:electron transfer flavoprotein subunit beta/FixA family protein [Desulfarculaceae bacterium]
MQVYVCAKHVPDTAANIKIKGENDYDTTGLKFVVNPYDEYGLEEAVRLVEKAGKGEVVIVTVGPAQAANTMRSALAMGAARGILVKSDDKFLDSRTAARALKAAIEKDGSPDMIFTGKTSVDTEGSQTPYRVAREFDFPVANEISALEIQDGKATAEREIGGGAREVLEMSTPCVIGATKGLNEPRYPKFPDIMKAKKKEIKEFELADLGIDAPASDGAPVKLEPVPERSGAKIMQGGSVRESVEELVKTLKDSKVL